MAGLSMPEARFAKKISFAVGGRLRATGRLSSGRPRRAVPAGPGAAGVPAARSLPPTAKATGKKSPPATAARGRIILLRDYSSAGVSSSAASSSGASSVSRALMDRLAR